MMTIDDPFPYLDHLLGAYFHQDAYEVSGGDEDVIRDFVGHAQSYEVMGVRADIHRFLHQFSGQPRFRETFIRIFSPSILGGDDDESTIAWLNELLKFIDRATESVNAS